VRLDRAEIAALRDSWAAGASATALAAEFEVSERHVRRLCQGVERDPVEEDDQRGPVERAMAAMVSDLELRDPSEVVLAETALTVAAKLDRADPRAASPLAGRLRELVDELASSHPPENALDELRRQRALHLAGIKS
jgi:hypothetical protein